MSTLSGAEQRRFAELQRFIDGHRHEFAALPDVIEVRPGFRVRRGRLTHEPAIVVTVRAKGYQIGPTLADRFPAVPIDVAPMTAADVVRLQQTPAPAGPAAVLFSPAPWAVHPPAAPMLGGAHAYTPPTGAQFSLNPIEDDMVLVCHASPDCGWPTLQPFLSNVQGRLSIAMYDFSAPWIQAELLALPSALDLTLVIDSGFSPKTGEPHEKDVLTAVGDHFSAPRVTYASTRKAGSLFATSYHAKVAVADRSAFWLSSGNWQGSNQPQIDPVNTPAHRTLARSRNREWHVIVEHDRLAALFDDYIAYDHDECVSAGAAAPFTEPLFEYVDPSLTGDEFARPSRRYFAAGEFRKRLRVQPLLTPDNYLDHVVSLIESAHHYVYVQNQYFNLNNSSGRGGLQPILDALVERVQQGVEVRLIFRNNDWPDPEGKLRAMLETLQAEGLEMGTHVRLQHRCHNKGIIVDGEKVLVSSHNWSPDGVEHNRDAGLIVYDREVAKYYEEIYEQDWTLEATEVVPDELLVFPVQPAGPALLTGAPRPLYE